MEGDRGHGDDGSVSDYFDHEPRLEFDDADMGLHCVQTSFTHFDFPSLNLEEELAEAGPVMPQDRFEDLYDTKIVQILGDDESGRRMIVISACNLPNNKELSYDRLLRFLIATLDLYVEQDYSLIYFHHGLRSDNRPPYSWLWKAYKAIDRKYKKNLKTLYIVHPTKWIKFFYNALKPIISLKFGGKIKYLNYLHELQAHIQLHDSIIPQPVLEYNSYLLSKDPRAEAASKVTTIQTLKENEAAFTKQFGVNLMFIKENNPDIIDSIPPVVRHCVEYLSQPHVMQTEGIFRRSANITMVRQLQEKCNKGDHEFPPEIDPHCVAVLLKTFLKDLQEPILTFPLYDEVKDFQSWSTDPSQRVLSLLTERLPTENYDLLKYIISFLAKVAAQQQYNKMTVTNLAIVFGPNMLWPKQGTCSLEAIGAINSFTEYIIANNESVFAS